MLLFWRIRYLDRQDKQFKDRDLWLETGSLDCVAKTAVEAIHDLKDLGHGREMLRYRHLFHEQQHSEAELNDLRIRHGGMSTVFIHDYFEDESGKELSSRQMAEILTGSPMAFMLPAGAKQYDIDYILADKRPIPLDQVSLSNEQLGVLGYFSRDLREILASAFFKDGPGTLTSSGGSNPTVQTAVTDEEIRSFVTIFRRLYMANEPANFVKAVTLFGELASPYPLGNWVKGVAAEYKRQLNEKPDFIPMVGREQWAFSRKLLIDVFLYTQYAHQPNEKRSRQYQECLTSVGNQADLLFWLFLTEMWHCALHIRNAGVIIANFYDRYCTCHQISPEVLTSIGTAHPSIGTLEKRKARQARILREKAEELAMELWKQGGRPEGGPAQFFTEARNQLSAALNDNGGMREEAE